MTDVYEKFQMERRQHNLKNNLKGNADAQETSQTSTQKLQDPPVSSRILYGLVALCAGLLLAVTTLCVFITYQQVRQNDPNLESALTNLSVSANAEAKHLSQEVAQALKKLDTMQGMVERIKQDYSTVPQALKKLDTMQGMVERMKQDYSTVPQALKKLDTMQAMVERMKQDYSTVPQALRKLDTMQGMVERMKQDYSTVPQALEKLDTMQGMVERMKQDYSTEALQKDIKKSLSALERLSDCARKETTNPLGPLCEDAWSPFQLNCYKLYGEKKTWIEAKQLCEAQKAHLIVINSDAEQDFMKDMSKGQHVWLGLTDADGSWKWVDGTPYDSVTRFWNDGQPDDWNDPKHGGTEDCASSVGSGKWNDAHCSMQHSFLCEKEL